ncbi:hypothetical protein BC455_22790 [Vibrio harveyi]|nr:hypothetical protein BC455_22790 [Vibrio harveyi]
MKSFERSIQRDYNKMPLNLKRYFVLEGKWFNLIDAIVKLGVLITLAIYVNLMVDETWLVGGKRLILQNLEHLPHPITVIGFSLGIFCAPHIFTVSARCYYLSLRNRWQTNQR